MDNQDYESEEIRESQDNQESEEIRESQDNQESEEIGESQESYESQESQELGESLEIKKSEEVEQNQESQEVGQNQEVEETNQIEEANKINSQAKKALPSRAKKMFLSIGIIVLVLLLFSSYLAFTRSGHRLIYKVAGKVIHKGLDNEDDVSASSVINPLEEQSQDYNMGSDWNSQNSNNQEGQDELATPIIVTEPRCEDYVSNYLIFGLEEIDNAKNTDSIMIASINTKDNTVKLTSLLRDTYIDLDDYEANKLNSFFSTRGARGLVDVVEKLYRIKIDGYAYINFESFETVIDYLGGISIELGEKEAKYLNKTNYISNPAYRKVKAGWNQLNGNQALGYCRVRFVETLGGATDDYGRTLRQRRVLRAVFNKYKSKNIFDLITISNNILGHIKTNVTQEQIEKGLEDVIENKITKMDTMRLPVNGTYQAPIEYNGIGYPLVLDDLDANIIQLYQFIFLDTEEEAKANLEKHR